MSRYDDINLNIGKRPILCSNLGLGEQGAVLSNLKSAIFVCPNIAYANKMKAQLDALHKDSAVINDFARPFTLSTYSNNDNKTDIINALNSLIKGDSIIISTPELLFSFLPDRETIIANNIQLNKTDEYDLIEIESSLVNLGYKKTEMVTSKGEFSRRGDILDIFITTDDNPTRIDFFDTQIENIYTFDFVTFEKIKTLENVNIAPNKLFLLNDEKLISSLYVYRPDIYYNNKIDNKTSNRPIRLGIVNKGGQGERIYSTKGIAVTLSANGGGIFAKTGGYLVNGIPRKLHPRECARLMGFPDSYKMSKNKNQAYKQFGNSVVVDVLQYIAIEIGKKLEGL